VLIVYTSKVMLLVKRLFLCFQHQDGLGDAALARLILFGFFNPCHIFFLVTISVA